MTSLRHGVISHRIKSVLIPLLWKGVARDGVLVPICFIRVPLTHHIMNYVSSVSMGLKKTPYFARTSAQSGILSNRLLAKGQSGKMV